MLLHSQPGMPSATPSPLNAGFDLRYGITPSLNLSVTLNPDFGQVELDPTVVNLTRYEVYFQERRPFFVEDADLFKTPLTIFYSRRVGAAPDLPDPTTPGGTITEAPTESPILLAAKITGHAGPRWRVGALTAVVGPTHVAAIAGADPSFQPMTSLDRTWSKPATDLILFKLERRWLQ